jgi:hypothetical protein
MEGASKIISKTFFDLYKLHNFLFPYHLVLRESQSLNKHISHISASKTKTRSTFTMESQFARRNAVRPTGSCGTENLSISHPE